MLQVTRPEANNRSRKTVGSETAWDWFGEERRGVSYLIGLLDYLPYYTVCEKMFRAYTLGKLITGTRAVRNDGRELMLKGCFFAQPFPHGSV